MGERVVSRLWKLLLPALSFALLKMRHAVKAYTPVLALISAYLSLEKILNIIIAERSSPRGPNRDPNRTLSNELLLIIADFN